MRFYSKKNSSLIAFLLCFLAWQAIAQKEPVKWGKVSEEELAMTTYEPDTAAAALVLCNYGELRFNLIKGDIRYDFQQHKRIKILPDHFQDRRRRSDDQLQPETGSDPLPAGGVSCLEKICRPGDGKAGRAGGVAEEAGLVAVNSG